MFATRFEKEGVSNTDTGRDYRQMVLAPGGVGDIGEHVAKFLRRKPTNEEFLRARGITAQ